jgi:hypothetical protein
MTDLIAQVVGGTDTKELIIKFSAVRRLVGALCEQSSRLISQFNDEVLEYVKACFNRKK